MSYRFDKLANGTGYDVFESRPGNFQGAFLGIVQRRGRVWVAFAPDQVHAVADEPFGEFSTRRAAADALAAL